LSLAILVIVIPPDTRRSRVRASRLPAQQPPGPNLLFLIADDHRGGVLGIDGDPRQATPQLDRLARQGVRFDRAYCNAPVCTASRQSFITGRLPHAVGVTQLPTRLADDAVTLGDWLGDQGYGTAAVGKMHFNGPSKHGFQARLDHADWLAHLKAHPPNGGDQRRPWRPFQDPAAVWLNAACQSSGLPEASMESTFYADRAIEFLDRRRADAKPFAMVVSFYDPHSPFRFPREYQGRFRPEQFSVPPISDFDRRHQPRIFRPLTPENVRGIQAAYYTSLSYVDHQVGRVLDALDASGLSKNTLVVYVGDNGYMLGQHGRIEKHCFYEPSVRVPLIMRWPGHLPENRRIDELVELVDLLPTLLELLGLPNPPDLHGQSLVPLIDGRPGAKGRDVVFSEYLENEEAMVRSTRYKLIVGTGRRERQDGYVTDDPLPGPYERLYDLEADPDETTDVADRPALAAVKRELRRRLYLRLVSTRLGLEPLPARLTELQAIHWCLVPRDERTP
jgi:choline-sulfatase